MGQEGQKNTSDTSGGEKRPWEVVPSDNNQQLTREEILAKREEKRVKRDTKVKESIKWTKKHIMLLIGAVLLIIALIVGGVILVTWLTGNKNTVDDKYDKAIEGTGFIDGMTIENALTCDYAYTYAKNVMNEEVLVGVRTEGSLDIIQYKFEDNIDAFIKKTKEEYYKTYYTIVGIDLLTNYGYVERAEHLLTLFDEEKHDLDKKQRYAYLMMKSDYYYAKNDKQKLEENEALLNKEYPPEYIDYDTKEVITDEKKIKEIEEAFKNRGKGE